MSCPSLSPSVSLFLSLRPSSLLPPPSPSPGSPAPGEALHFLNWASSVRNTGLGDAFVAVTADRVGGTARTIVPYSSEYHSAVPHAAAPHSAVPHLAVTHSAVPQAISLPCPGHHQVCLQSLAPTPRSSAVFIYDLGAHPAQDSLHAACWVEGCWVGIPNPCLHACMIKCS